MTLERLQKVLARAGVASRRACEELIANGRVTVDGKAVTTLGVKADPDTQDIRLDGGRLRPERHEYWILNKPKGVVCTNYDPSGRRRPIDFFGHTKARLFPVGRLDADSKGLLLMTNDGEFANRLTHPRYGVPKTYVATILGEVTRQDVARLRRGVYLAEGRTRSAEVRLKNRSQKQSVVELTIREGRNRQIRRMLARTGHPIRELLRTRIGRITLRGLSAGHARRLTDEEIEYLKTLPDQPAPERRPAKARPGRADKHHAERGPTDAAKPPRRGGRTRRSRNQDERPWHDRSRPARKPSSQQGGIPGKDAGRRTSRPGQSGRDKQAQKKRSRSKHDTIAVGKRREGHGRDAGGSRSGKRSGRKPPPGRGRGPRGHSPK